MKMKGKAESDNNAIMWHQ